MNKIDDKLVGTLGFYQTAPALVKVNSYREMIMLERQFYVTHRYPFINAVGINCTLDDAKKLEAMREVEYVSAQSKVATLAENQVWYGYNANNSRSNFPFEIDWKGRGKGTVICVMDTGVSVHSDLSIPVERITKFVDFVGGKTEPYDDNGHGTFVCGVAVGNGMSSGKEVVGVAPDANIVAVKVIEKNGETGTFKILDGMQWVYDNCKRLNIKVVCMSFGAEPMTYADPLKMGAEMLVSRGLSVVCAVGNSGKDVLKSPAISSDVIAVGAVDVNGDVADFSSRGNYQGTLRPDVYANGVNVQGIKAGGVYSYMSGTSVSAPFVAGAALLLNEKYKNISPYQVKQAILASSLNKNGIRILSGK